MSKMSKNLLKAIADAINFKGEIKQVKDDSSIDHLDNCNLRENSAIYIHHKNKTYSIEALITRDSDVEIVDEAFYISTLDIDVWVSLGYLIAN